MTNPIDRENPFIVQRLRIPTGEVWVLDQNDWVISPGWLQHGAEREAKARAIIDLALERRAVVRARSRAFWVLLEWAQFAYYAWVRESDE